MYACVFVCMYACVYVESGHFIIIYYTILTLTYN